MRKSGLETSLVFGMCLAATTLATSRAHAETAPAAPAPATTMGVLSTPTGLTAKASGATAGLANLDQEKLALLVKSVSALDLTAHFHADANMKTQTIAGNKVNPGADVILKAHFDRQQGQSSATLDSLELDTPNNPGLIALKQVTIDSKGAIQVSVGGWLPKLSFKSIEHKSDGSFVLHGSFPAPDVKVDKDGNTSTIFGIKLGKINPTLLTQWPPTLASVEGLATAPPNPNEPDVLAQVSQLAGTLSWHMAATVDNNIVAVGSKNVAGTVTADVSGSGRLANGTVTTAGDGNTASVTFHVAPQEIDTHDISGNVNAATIALNGNYHLEAPLRDPQKHLNIDFNGKGSYSVDGSQVHLVLPNGTQITAASASSSQTSDVTGHYDAGTGAIDVSENGTFTAKVAGALTIKNLGPVATATLNGNLTASGADAIKAHNGAVGVTVTGSAEEQETAIGIVQILEGQHGHGSATILPGSKLSLNQGSLESAIQLSAVPQGTQSNLLAVRTSSSRFAGAIAGELGVDNPTFAAPGAAVAVNGTAQVGIAGGAAGTIGNDGAVTLDPTQTHVSVPVNVGLKAGSTVTLTSGGAPTKFTLDRDGSTVQLTGDFAVDQNGQPVLKDLSNVNVQLTLGPAKATIAGKTIAMNTDKKVSLVGRVVMRPNGFDVFGTVQVSASSQGNTPLLSVNY